MYGEHFYGDSHFYGLEIPILYPRAIADGESVTAVTALLTYHPSGSLEGESIQFAMPLFVRYGSGAIQGDTDVFGVVIRRTLPRASLDGESDLAAVPILRHLRTSTFQGGADLSGLALMRFLRTVDLVGDTLASIDSNLIDWTATPTALLEGEGIVTLRSRTPPPKDTSLMLITDPSKVGTDREHYAKVYVGLDV